MDNGVDPGRDSLTEAVLGAAFEVSNVLGHGFLEAVYRRALIAELRIRGLVTQQEVGFPVTYKGETVGRYVADLIVGNRLLVELKSAEALSSAHTAQVLNYLKASGIEVALLINFGKPRVEFRRFTLSQSAG